MGNQLDALRKYLSGVPRGTVEDETKIDEIEDLLFACWDEVVGDLGGMKADKLFGRMKEMEWKPPLLTFRIVRHGSAALGSVHGDRQEWTINVSAGTKAVAEAGKPLVRPRQRNLDVKPMAEEVVGLILAGKLDERLKWDGEAKVRILIGRIIPDEGPAQTLRGRRKRLRKAIEDRLREHGWQKAGINKFAKRHGDEKTGTV